MVEDKTASQFQVVRRVMTSPEVDAVVCATDAGREGELIFRYIYEAAGCRKPVRRLWVSSLTEGAIREGFRALKPGRDYDGLADAAKGRSRADWLVGMNLSRLYTLAGGDTLSVGRVQTPTLAMVVERELAIRDFVPKEYLEVVATFGPAGPEGPQGSYQGTWFRPAEPGKEKEWDSREARRLPADGVEAKAVVARVRGGPRGRGVRHRRDEADGGAAALRSDGAAAPRQPPVRLSAPSAPWSWRRRCTRSTSC